MEKIDVKEWRTGLVQRAERGFQNATTTEDRHTARLRLQKARRELQGVPDARQEEATEAQEG